MKSEVHNASIQFCIILWVKQINVFLNVIVAILCLIPLHYPDQHKRKKMENCVQVKANLKPLYLFHMEH